MLHELLASSNPVLQWLLGIDEDMFSPTAEWKLGWENLPSIWLLVLIVIPAVIGFSILVYRFEPEKTGTKTKAVLSTLRILVLLLLLAMIFQPYIYMEVSLERENHVGLLVDNSKSMDFVDQYQDQKLIQQLNQRLDLNEKSTDQSNSLAEQSRLDLINTLFRNRKTDVLDPIKQQQNVNIYTFSDQLHGEKKEPSFSIDQEGNSTAIGDAIQQFVKELRGRQISSIVLFTDGQFNAGADPSVVARKLSQQQNAIPIYPVAVGNPYLPVDLQLRNLQAPDVTQVNDFVSFQCTIYQKGSIQGTTSVSLRLYNEQTGELLEQKPLTLKNEKTNETLRWKPTEPGNYPLKLELSPTESEITTKNNVLHHNLQVIKDKIRVLYIEDLPRYEYRYLKNALIRDRSLKTQVLLKSAHSNYVQPSSPGVDSLTEFPGSIDQLAKYDVIIIGDVSPYELRSPGQSIEQNFQNLKRFVEELGGGIFFLAGARKNPWDYVDTPLYSLLPVLVDPEAPSVKSGPFHMELTPIWDQFPILKVLPEGQKKQNRKLWETPPENEDGSIGTPPLRRYIPVIEERMGARTLAVHPSDRSSSNKKRPLLVIQQTGRGRTIFFGTDDAWRWRKMIGDRHFYGFYGQALRWLRGGRLQGSKRFELSVNKKQYNLGEKVEFTARILNQNYQPVEEQTYPIHIFSQKTKSEKTIELTMNEQPGQYSGAFRPETLGNYRAWIGSMPEDPDQTKATKDYAEENFQVLQKNLEMQDPSVNVEGLKNIAEISGGKFLFLHELPISPPHDSSVPSISELVKGNPKTVELESRRSGLWDAPLIIILFALLLGIEWFLRKRMHMI